MVLADPTHQELVVGMLEVEVQIEVPVQAQVVRLEPVVAMVAGFLVLAQALL